MRSSFDKSLYSSTCQAVGSMLLERKAQRDYSNTTLRLPVGQALLTEQSCRTMIAGQKKAGRARWLNPPQGGRLKPWLEPLEDAINAR
jgi:hypothetical protein